MPHTTKHHEFIGTRFWACILRSPMFAGVYLSTFQSMKIRTSARSRLHDAPSNLATVQALAICAQEVLSIAKSLICSDSRDILCRSDTNPVTSSSSQGDLFSKDTRPPVTQLLSSRLCKRRHFSCPSWDPRDFNSDSCDTPASPCTCSLRV